MVGHVTHRMLSYGMAKGRLEVGTDTLPRRLEKGSRVQRVRSQAHCLFDVN